MFVRTGGPPDPDGPPVVLVAGLGGSGRYLAPTAAALAAHRLVVAPDLPGTGRSPHAARPLTITQLSDTLHDLIGTCTGAPVVIVANSFGCQVAVEPGRAHAGSAVPDPSVGSGPCAGPADGSSSSWHDS